MSETTHSLRHHVITVDIVIFIAYWCLPCLSLIHDVKESITPWMTAYAQSRRNDSTTFTICIRQITWYDTSVNASATLSHHIEQVPTMFLQDVETRRELPYSRHVGTPSDADKVDSLLRKWQEIMKRHLESIVANSSR